MGRGPEISVEVNPESFTFSYQNRTIRVATLVTVAIEDKRKIIAVGENLQEPTVLTIPLFNSDQELSRDIDKLDLLTAFFAFSIGKIFKEKKLPVLRPLMIFHGVQQLEKILCGYHTSLLKEAVINGGARGFRFD
jgi:hypothetical protein